jgi:ribosomal-protein-alanine acetyltransferase/tRNA threonylcarbamoyl adenosine modification protein YeaZ
VRIGVATAKGLAQGLGVPLYAASTLEAVAWRVAEKGLPEGTELVGVVGDAMRGEVYPALFRVSGGSVVRVSADRVCAPAEVAAGWADAVSGRIVLAGNGLAKYRELFDDLGAAASIAAEDLWAPSGAGVLAAYRAARLRGDAGRGEPALVLPVYTRLSDAEEAERERACQPVTTPVSGVAGEAAGATSHMGEVRIRPMSLNDIDEVVAIEQASFSDPWSAASFAEEITAPRRAWLVAEQDDGRVVAYGGVAAFGDEAHLMNLGVSADRRRLGIGRVLLERLLERARELGPRRITLEVRESNADAVKLYESVGLSTSGDVGRSRRRKPGSSASLAGDRETSCDETAAAVLRGRDSLVANVVASQWTSMRASAASSPRSRAASTPRRSSASLTRRSTRPVTRSAATARCRFGELDAIAVTHGPGLVGALVVGLAYAKGLSYAAGVPLVGVNHLEGHIFANVMAIRRSNRRSSRCSSPAVTHRSCTCRSGASTTRSARPSTTRPERRSTRSRRCLAWATREARSSRSWPPTGDPRRSTSPGDDAQRGLPVLAFRLKTAVINHIRHEREAGREIDVPDLAASFQAAVVDVQVAKAVRAVQETGARAFCLAGGVAANPALREALRAAIEPLGVHVSVPPFHLCTDNAAMIAAAAYHRFHAASGLTSMPRPIRDCASSPASTTADHRPQ